MAVGTEEVDHRIPRRLVLLVNGGAAIKAGESDPAVFLPEGHSHSNRRITINIMVAIHKAVIAAGTGDFYGKDSLVRLNIHSVKPGPGLMNNLFNLGGSDIRKIVPVHGDNGAKGAGAETVHRLQGDLPVFGGLSCFDL
jgi:hypothetical protein